MDEQKWFDMNKDSVDGRYRETAIKLLHKERGDNLQEMAVEIRYNAEVSRGSHPGAWVQAWVWIPEKLVTGNQQQPKETSVDLEAEFEKWWQSEGYDAMTSFSDLGVKNIAKKAFALGVSLGKGEIAGGELVEAMKELQTAQKSVLDANMGEQPMRYEERLP